MPRFERAVDCGYIVVISERIREMCFREKGCKSSCRYVVKFRVDFTTESRLSITDFLTTATSAPLCSNEFMGKKKFKALYCAGQVYVCALVDVRVSFEM